MNQQPHNVDLNVAHKAVIQQLQSWFQTQLPALLSTGDSWKVTFNGARDGADVKIELTSFTQVSARDGHKTPTALIPTNE